MRGILSNLHTHTRYSDGLDEACQYVEKALDLGFRSLGFSEHAYAPYDPDCCIKWEDIPKYLAELRALRERYRGRIEIYLGFENDYYHPSGREEVDFLIGSVHYLRDEATGAYYTIDYRDSTFAQAVERVGGGDIRRMLEVYYHIVGDMAVRQQPDIIGHMDLVTKLNRDNRYFDPAAGWYLAAVEGALDAIREAGCTVEVNTGGIARGYIDRPYPDRPILERMRALDIPVTVSSDAHQAEHLAAAFPLAAALLGEVGYTHTRQLIGGAFVDVPLA